MYKFIILINDDIQACQFDHYLEKFDIYFNQERNFETNAWEYTFELIYNERIEK
jgi:hypothetical protein